MRKIHFFHKSLLAAACLGSFVVGALFVAFLEQGSEQMLQESQTEVPLTVRLAVQVTSTDEEHPEEIADIRKEVTLLEARVKTLSRITARWSVFGQCLDDTAERLFFLRQKFDRSADHPNELKNDPSLVGCNEE